jgi:hypothetical protein
MRSKRRIVLVCGGFAVLRFRLTLPQVFLTDALRLLDNGAPFRVVVSADTTGTTPSGSLGTAAIAIALGGFGAVAPFDQYRAGREQGAKQLPDIDLLAVSQSCAGQTQPELEFPERIEADEGAAPTNGDTNTVLTDVQSEVSRDRDAPQ